MQNLISLILLATALSLGLNIFLKRRQIESIVGYIITGAIIAYVFELHSLENESLNLVAELGIAFLMFSIGLEFSLHKIHTIRKRIFVYGGLQFALTSAIFFSIFYFWLQTGARVGLILSFGLAMSSTAIVLKLLNKKNKIKTTYGKNATGILLFQDMAVIPILIMVSVFAQGGQSLGDMVLQTLGSAVVVLFFLWLGGFYIVPYIMNLVTNPHSSELFITTILLLVVGSAHLAHMFGFSYSLGAFVAGLLIAETQHKEQIKKDLLPFRNVLLGVFFVTVGMQVDLEFIPAHWGEILGILGCLILIKLSIIYIVMRHMYAFSTSLRTAIILAQVGEFSFAIFELARISGLLESSDLVQIIIVAIVLSMVLASLVFTYLELIMRSVTHTRKVVLEKVKK